MPCEGTCTWGDDPGEVWVDRPCPVEGCQYLIDGDEPCGLSRFLTVEEQMALWDAGDPVERGCVASRCAEDAFLHIHCETG